MSHLGKKIWGDKQAETAGTCLMWQCQDDLWHVAQEPGRMGEAALSTVTFVLFVLGEGWPG